MLFLLFELGLDRYALAAGRVVEVLPLVSLKQLPQAPEGLAGVFDYRGTPVPVIDLSQLALSRPARRLLSTRIIVVRQADGRDGQMLMGLIAERVTETLQCAEADFLPSGVINAAAPYLGPVRRSERGLVQRIEIDELLPEAIRAVLSAPAEAA